jgi:hypothetical protein
VTAGARVERHTDHFPQDVDDLSLLRSVAEKGWLFLTKDVRISKNELARRTIQATGVRAFFLAAGNLSGPDQAQAFVRALPKMKRIAQGPGPLIVRITQSGAVNVLRRGNG